jgi:Baseplate J-like protein
MASVPPLLFTSAGPQATPPATLQAALIAGVTAKSPGFTADLPGILIEDITSTDVFALSTIDQARVDAVNNVSPVTANPFILAAQGQQFGLPQGTLTNSSALVVFSGSPGYVIPPGFIVSDGTNQYMVEDGGTIATGGSSQQLSVVATNASTFAIPPNSITQTVTSVPTGFTVTVTNPEAGDPAMGAETVESYRSRLIGAQQVTISGAQTYLKTLLFAVPGVSQRLVSVLQNGSAWEVICGGGDAFQTAGAIYQSGVNVAGLVGSSTTARNVSVSIFDAPNDYTVIYVNPPAQVVTLAITWNTTLTDFTASSAVGQAMVTAALSYINGITVGQPINLIVLSNLIQAAVASVLPVPNLTTLEFAFTINGDAVEPSAGTSIIASDPESFMSAAANAVTATQG